MANLSHYGILGMKWGVRRRGPASGDHTQARELKKKHVSELSNDEIRKAVTRMQLERQYKDLAAGEVSAGQKFLTSLLVRVGKNAAKDYANSQGYGNIANVIDSIPLDDKKKG